jgi:hypothetical protein
VSRSPGPDARPGLQPLQEAAERHGRWWVIIYRDETYRAPLATASGRNHTIRHAALEYSVIPFSSYV